MEEKYKVLPKSDKVLFQERELLMTHSPFRMELNLFNAIKDGDKEKLNNAIQEYMINGFILGNMTDNSIQEIRYWAVATISLSVHYAILGGLDETDAFNFSDICIRHIDKIKTFGETLDYLIKKSGDLVDKVNSSSHLSGNIRKCVHYIHIHLHEKISVGTLSEVASLSSDYLSLLFRKETGMTIHQYILKEKLKESLKLIEEGKSFQEISYILHFCSQTHFIQAFKKEYGYTPSCYRKNL